MTRNNNEPLRILELFGGIGACTSALQRLGIKTEIVDYVEIDKYATTSYNAIHGTNFEPQDIRLWDKDVEVDLIMHGSPCQDFSVAGKQAGGDKGSGTRSSLMYETLRIVKKLKPKYVIWENVKNLVSKKHFHNFQAYLDDMEDLGYRNYWQVLNAKNYGIPQNRERVFTISILGDDEFEFPAPFPLKTRLKDILEDKVDEKYYLSSKQVSGFVRSTEKAQSKGNGFKFEPTDGDTIGHAVCTTAGSRQTDNFIKVAGRCPNINGHDILKRIYDPNGVSPTLSTMGGGNTEPKIIDDIYKNRPPRVYDRSCPTIRANHAGDIKVARDNDPFCVASRGRGKANKQQLEPRLDGVTNTITTVQKDNYVAESLVLPGAYGRNYGSKGKLETGDIIGTLQAAMGEGGGNVPLVPINTANKQGYDLAKDGDGIDLAYPNSKTRRGRVGHGVSKTIETSPNMGCLEGFSIRKLTPKECWRLMGFEDWQYEKAQLVNSNTQLYKQAGNSIVVDVLVYIFKQLFSDSYDQRKDL